LRPERAMIVCITEGLTFIDMLIPLLINNNIVNFYKFILLVDTLAPFNVTGNKFIIDAQFWIRKSHGNHVTEKRKKKKKLFNKSASKWSKWNSNLYIILENTCIKKIVINFWLLIKLFFFLEIICKARFRIFTNFLSMNKNVAMVIFL
jgi:hypothetical protein